MNNTTGSLERQGNLTTDPGAMCAPPSANLQQSGVDCVNEVERLDKPENWNAAQQHRGCSVSM